MKNVPHSLGNSKTQSQSPSAGGTFFLVGGRFRWCSLARGNPPQREGFEVKSLAALPVCSFCFMMVAEL